MKLSDFSRCAFGICATAAMLAGCGGSQPPMGEPGGRPQTSSPATRADRGKSWMTQVSSSDDLLYVSDPGSKAVEVYSYPRGVEVGQLTGLGTPGGLCADGAGDVFVTNIGASGSANVLEFAHGGTTPIQTLNDPGMFPNGCAVNSVTGDLAVANYCPFNQGACGNGRGNILIYPEAKGSPQSYSDPVVTHFSYCGYDARGTLYADGYGRRSHFFELLKLRKSGDKLATIRIRWTYSKPKIVDPGGLQWDGKLLAIGYPQGENIIPSIYRVVPTSGRIAEVLTLRKSQSVFQFFIDGTTLIAPNLSKKDGGQILFYSYPKGTKLSKVIGGLNDPQAVVVSRGVHR